MPVKGQRRSLSERFWSKVKKTAACWVWDGSRNGFGYGMIGVGGSKPKMLRAHRVSYELHYGPITDGRLVCHRCDNPPCVRPDHLFLGTQHENLTDMVRKGRQHLHRKPTCKNGHLFPVDAFEVRQDGRLRRECEVCKQGAQNRYAAKRSITARARYELVKEYCRAVGIVPGTAWFKHYRSAIPWSKEMKDRRRASTELPKENDPG